MYSYRERLSPAWWLVVALGLLLPGSLLIFLPLNPAAGIAVGLVLWWGSVALLWLSAPVITVSAEQLSAGSASIERSFIARVDVYDKDDARVQRGTGLDARAWLVLRGWIDPVVKVTLNDPQDPTPYWLISSRRPAQLAHALERVEQN